MDKQKRDDGQPEARAREMEILEQTGGVLPGVGVDDLSVTDVPDVYTGPTAYDAAADLGIPPEQYLEG